MRLLMTSIVSAMFVATTLPAPAHAGAAADPTQWAPPTGASRAAAAPASAAERPAKKKACTRGKQRCRAKRVKVDPRLVEARERRSQLLATAAPMVASGREGEAARLLTLAAEANADPVLFLAAAEAILADPRAGKDSLAAAVSLTQDAKQLVLTPGDLRITPEEGPRLLEEGQQLAAFAGQRQERLRLHRRGHAERTTGAVFLLVGLGGVGMLASGAALNSRVDAARTDFTGSDVAYLDALTRTKARADTLLAAGLVTGLVGAAIGIPLMVTGSRDLKRSRSAGTERPSFRIAPGLASVSITGRF